MTIVIVVTVILGISLLLIKGALNSYQPDPLSDVDIDGPSCPMVNPDASLTFRTWNLGFAGMSAEMDFRPDGGRRIRASSVSQVEANCRSLLEQIRNGEASVLFLQELARGSFLTRGVDVLEFMQNGLSEYRAAYSPTIRVLSLPLAGDLEFGKATLAAWDMTDGVRRSLPTTPDLLSVTVQHFNILETRLPVAGENWEWVLLNIHLAAFDDGPLRKEQLEQVVALMETEYRAGNRVVAGGDWNLLLADTEFPYSTDEKNRFWVRGLPAGVVPPGWQWGVDPTTPTCRTLEQPYRPGVNYTCVIDGFLVTPNVEIESVETMNLEFANSDHHPVKMQVRSQ